MREKLIELLDEATFKLKELCGGYNDGTGNTVRADYLIANGVEIPVHCCDCARCVTHTDDVGCQWLFCERQNGRPVDPTDFCSYGERRNDV